MNEQIKNEIKKLIQSKLNDNGDISDSDYQEVLDKAYSLGVDPIEFKIILDSLLPQTLEVETTSYLKNQIEINTAPPVKKLKTRKKVIIGLFILGFIILTVFNYKGVFKKYDVNSLYQDLISFAIQNNEQLKIFHRYKNGFTTEAWTEMIFQSKNQEIEISYPEPGTIYYITERGKITNLRFKTYCGLSECQNKLDFSITGNWTKSSKKSRSFILNFDKEGFLSISIYTGSEWQHWSEFYIKDDKYILSAVNKYYKEQHGRNYFD